ncbi:MAG: glucokinase [Pseudomonadales bacterium]|jgi:glucokinase|nr:glucokinase [Pseudomonadales bacterium]
MTLLCADIGGTSARMALASADDDALRAVEIVPCRDHPSAEHCLYDYLERHGGRAPTHLVIAAAGPVRDGQVAFTNSRWVLDEQALTHAFHGAVTRVVNDFEAIAVALPDLGAGDLLEVGRAGLPRTDTERFTVALLGPGTGLGAGGLLRRDGHTLALPSEAGHTDVAPTDAEQHALLRQIAAEGVRLSGDTLLSGPGLERLHAARRALAGTTGARLSAAGIFEQAVAGDETCRATLSLYARLLGQAAGDLVLTLAAWEGLFLAGGVLQRHPGLFDASAFRAGFEAKGPHTELMARVPTALITHPWPGLLGAAAIARQLAAPPSTNPAMNV